MSVPPRTDDPRPHHYRFAHRWLPGLSHRHGLEILRAAPARDLTPALVAMWNDCGERLPVEQRLDPAGLEASYRPDPDAPMIVVTMPAARHMVEAHFAAMALVDGGMRYLVLEESWSPEQAVATVLGEWTADGSHLNLGPGPVPDRGEFVRAVLTAVGAIGNRE
jgi:hypothetical protein